MSSTSKQSTMSFIIPFLTFCITLAPGPVLVVQSFFADALLVCISSFIVVGLLMV